MIISSVLGQHHAGNSDAYRKREHPLQRQYWPTAHNPYNQFLNRQYPFGGERQTADGLISRASFHPSRQSIYDPQHNKRVGSQLQSPLILIDNQIGSFLKKALLESTLFSRANWLVTPQKPVVRNNYRYYDKATEERDWKTSLALSINATIDSISLQDKMTVFSEYHSIYDKEHGEQNLKQLLNLHADSQTLKLLLDSGLRGKHVARRVR